MDQDGHDPHNLDGDASAGTALAASPARKSIVVNGRTHEVLGDTIGRDEIARLAFPGLVPDARGALTIAYDHGPAEAPDGLIAPNRTTRVLHGQTFSVSLTDKS